MRPTTTLHFDGYSRNDLRQLLKRPNLLSLNLTAFNHEHWLTLKLWLCNMRRSVTLTGTGRISLFKHNKRRGNIGRKWTKGNLKLTSGKRQQIIENTELSPARLTINISETTVNILWHIEARYVKWLKAELAVSFGMNSWGLSEITLTIFLIILFFPCFFIIIIFTFIFIISKKNKKKTRKFEHFQRHIKSYHHYFIFRILFEMANQLSARVWYQPADNKFDYH